MRITADDTALIAVALLAYASLGTCSAVPKDGGLLLFLLLLALL
jgi:hypothetical protein